jgi:two-component system phosphate regulon sensor histidine kinase PhoR
MVASLAEQLEPVASSKHVQLACHCEPAVEVIGDTGWIERIVLNLLDNAIKFTRSGGRVNVRVSHDSSNAILEVEDNGIGITPESIPRVFERFYRADGARSNRADGAGLGLSLVKWAVDQHAGSVHIDSAPGQGSRFTVYLPLVS